MRTPFLSTTKALILSVVLGIAGMSPAQASDSTTVYRTVKVENLEIFYREAGDPNKPTLLPWNHTAPRSPI